MSNRDIEWFDTTVIPYGEYLIMFMVGALVGHLSIDAAIQLSAIAFFGLFFGALAYNHRAKEGGEKRV